MAYDFETFVSTYQTLICNGKPIVVFENHNMAFPAWGCISSHLQKELNLITLDTHADTRPPCAVRLGAKKVTLLYSSSLSKRSFEQESVKLAREEGVSVIENAAQFLRTASGVSFTKDGADMELYCDQVLVVSNYSTQIPDGDADFLVISKERINSIISAITAGKNAAATIDQAICGTSAILAPVSGVKTVSPELVRKRTGYLKRDNNPIKLTGDAYNRIHSFAPYQQVMTEEEALKEASRCLNCGCGEGCQLCKTICTDFAPEVSNADTLHIRKESCVACGMCFNRCPNRNIEMVNQESNI